MYFKYDVSIHDEYYSQINNKLFPMSSCNTTSAIMALIYNKIPFTFPKGVQPEDYLTSILESKEAYEKLRIDFPWAVKEGYPPREVHGMLEWGINKLTGKTYDKFSTSTTIQEVIFNLVIKKEASLMTGRFTGSGHIVCVSGFITTQENMENIKTKDEVNTSLITKIIVDDPYGNYHTEYKDSMGNNVEFLFNEFNGLTKNYHSKHKWVHTISKDNIKD